MAPLDHLLTEVNCHHAGTPCSVRKSQSPIDIDTGKLTYNQHLDVPVVHDYQATEGYAVNTGHVVDVCSQQAITSIKAYFIKKFNKIYRAKTPEERAVVDLDTHYTKDYLDVAVGETKRRSLLQRRCDKSTRDFATTTDSTAIGKVSSIDTYLGFEMFVLMAPTTQRIYARPSPTG